MSLFDLGATLCVVVSVVSIVYWLLCDAWLHAFFRGAAVEDDALSATPAITFFRPLKAGVTDMRGKLQMFVEEMRDDDQLLFGVESGTEEARLSREIVDAFPARNLAVIEGARGAALNPKIAKLIQMAPAAKHEHWVVVDSEFVAETEWLARFRREWLQSGNDAFTAGYRFTGIGTFLQALDAIPILLSLWPGLGTVARNGKLTFMLGAVIALRRRDVEAIGGFQRFADDLAEDNRLGSALVGKGGTVGLSREVATLSSDPLSWRDYWRHQRRVAVTYRVCNPAGFAGMICTHGVTFAVVLVLLKSEVPAAWGVLGATLACRWWTAYRLGTLLRFSVPHLFSSTVVASLIETVCWFAAWISTTVWWAAKRWDVRRDGILRENVAGR